MFKFNESKKLIEKANSIAIFTHQNADGDAIGSAFALFYYLKNLNKEVSVFTDTKVLPNQLEFLKVDKLINSGFNKKYDLHIAVDSNNPDMLGRYKQKFLSIDNSVQFDHHPLNPEYASINNIETDVSSASEIVARYFIDNSIKIDEKIAIFLLSGIITDSGGFKFSCTTSKTMETVQKLLSVQGVSLSDVMSALFESETKDSFTLQKYAYNHTEFILNGKACVVVIDYNFYKTTGIDPNACKFLTRIGTELKDIIFTAVLSEVEPGVTKVSFRSRRGYKASSCAEKFGGGGHLQAAGCKIFGSLSSTVNKIKKVIAEELNGRNC